MTLVVSLSSQRWGGVKIAANLPYISQFVESLYGYATLPVL